MCGICGLVNADSGRPVPAEQIRRMRDVMVHRGPDDAGEFLEGPVGLGHRRLSILDLSPRGHQPMSSASGRFWITYNGEIYNFRRLREDLEAKGYRFKSESDTEVLVNGFEEWGLAGLLPRLDGIFAFAVWDRAEQRLSAARDQLGVKPLYYTTSPQGFAFGSEIKALWAAGFRKEVDLSTFEELLIFRMVAGENTPFKGVKRLLPGHCLEYSNGSLNVRPYWQAADHVDSDESYVQTWKERFARAIIDQRISDVPIGTLLSGGLDSSIVTAELARAERDSVQTFTVSVPPEEGLDEWPYAEAVAERWSCKSHKLQVPAGDVLERLRRTQSFHDEPLAHGNDMHIFEISRLAKEHVTVLLSGEGADELLGGYTRYEPIRKPWLAKLATSGAAAPIRSLMGLVPSRKVWRLQRLLSLGSLKQAILYNAADLLPGDLKSLGLTVEARFEARNAILDGAMLATREPIRQLMLYDMQTFLCSILNRNDRMTMAASIECRVPFLAVGVVEAALKLPTNALYSGRNGKQILREYASGLLPDEVLTRPKWGLGIPWPRYMRNDPKCRSFVEGIPRSEFARAIEAPGLATAIAGFLKGDDRKAGLVYQLFALAVWWEQVVDASGGCALPDE
ncbi:MAG: asparagine synthase (glutamine-hydrolyzing) [Chloroflexi bacterium]|nr:asparagine synthase (glutamine-hydrolyzing) [Chloroflexota bacterium]